MDVISIVEDSKEFFNDDLPLENAIHFLVNKLSLAPKDNIEDIYNILINIATISYDNGYDIGSSMSYARGYAEAAQSTYAWIQRDRDGNDVHIDDLVHYDLDPEDINIRVIGFTGTHFIGSDNKFYNIDFCTLVNMDTEEKIIEEMVECGLSVEKAEELVSRLADLA